MTDTLPDLQIRTVNAVKLARAWLAVAQASSDDEENPVLYKTVSVETFDHGVQLIATDSAILARCFVPWGEGEDETVEIEEACLSETVVTDRHGRAAGLMRHILSLYGKEDEIVPQLQFGDSVISSPQDSFDGFERKAFTICLPGSEELLLPTIDLSFPDWRPLWFKAESTPTTNLMLGPEYLGKIAKIGKLFKPASSVWSFAGSQQAANFTVGPVSGLLMPLANAVVDA